MRNMVRSLFCFLVLFLLISAATPVRANDNYVIESFEWTFSNRDWKLEVNISQDSLNAYKSFSVDKRRNYEYMITTEDEALIEAANDFLLVSVDNRYDRNTEANFVLTFVQSLDYTSDKVTEGYKEYPRFPLETLSEHGGDCEDTSVLYATLMILMEFDAVLFLMPGDVEDPGHMAVGIANEGFTGSYIEKDGKKYYYAETTGKNWKIGDIPPDYTKESFIIIEFTGAQYDPFSKEEPENIVVEFWKEHPGLFLLFFAFLLIILVLIYYMFLESKRNSEEGGRSDQRRDRDRNSSRKANGTGDGGYEEYDDEPFYDEYLYEMDLLRRTREDAPASRKRRPSSWESRCPNCSSLQIYDREYDDWRCERCDEEADDYSRKYYERRINNRRRKIHGY